METSFLVKYNQFIILSVNENTAGASGCSIDGSVRVLKELSQRLNNDLFNRTRVAFLNEGKVKLYPIKDLSALFELGNLTATSITFNNLVPDKATFDTKWETAVENTWLVKYLPKGTLSV